ncbi:MAG: PAS domain-containing protein [Caldilinea sp.]
MMTKLRSMHSQVDDTRRDDLETPRCDKQLLRLLIEHTPASIAMFDRNMRYLVVSRRFLVDYDLGEQDLIGRSHYEVFPEIPERWKEIHRRCLAGAVERCKEEPFPRKDGRLDWVRWEIHPWHEENGEIGGVILFSEVITERKQAEEELRLSRDQLAELTRRFIEAQEAERRAIGRELHDQIGQMLTAIKIMLEIARQLPAEAAAKKITQAQELAAELLGRVSRLSLELRPAMLDDLGLVPVLVWYVNRYQEQTGISVEFKHNGIEGKRFSTAIETTVYRIIQETLTNKARHAHATSIQLTIGINEGWLEIRSDDNGIGFDTQTALAKNRGLAGIRERVQLVCGVFQIESEKDKGAQLFIRLPLHKGVS